MIHVTTTSLHTVADAARALHVGIATVEAMIRAGQLATVTPAGSAYPRVTGASILAFANVVPEPEPEPAPAFDIRELLDRKRGPSEPALAPLWESLKQDHS